MSSSNGFGRGAQRCRIAPGDRHDACSGVRPIMRQGTASSIPRNMGAPIATIESARAAVKHDVSR